MRRDWSERHQTLCGEMGADVVGASYFRGGSRSIVSADNWEMAMICMPDKPESVADS